MQPNKTDSVRYTSFFSVITFSSHAFQYNKYIRMQQSLLGQCIYHAFHRSRMPTFLRILGERNMRHGPRCRFMAYLGHILLVAATGLPAAKAGQEPANEAPPPIQLEQSAVSAAGRNTIRMQVSRLGRYSIIASSPQGTALQLVDRMAGPGSISGSAGEADGRLDMILERGEYQIVTYGHEHASGTAEIAVHPFAEQNLPLPPRLIELKTVEKQLQDFEQLSYWLDIEERGRVTLEAAGRSLADLRLWKDGNWLMDLNPEMEIIYPFPGRPLLSCRLTAELDPGLYLLTAYGGPPQPWSEDSESHPFYLRSGIPRLGEAGRQSFIVSPFGLDRYLVPRKATYFRLELPEAVSAALQVGLFNPKNPFDPTGTRMEISKESPLPIAEITTSSNPNNEHIVTIAADAGQSYIFQQFEQSYSYTFKGTGEYWISSIHSGVTSDSIDATAIGVLSNYLSQERIEPLFTQTVEIGFKRYWHRRFNLLEQATLFLSIEEAGKYQLLCREGEVQHRIEPFFINRPQGYRTPSMKSCGEVWELDPGYHVLTLSPVKKGIVHVLLRPMGFLDKILDTVGWERSLDSVPFRGSARFSKVYLSQDNSYRIYINRQPEVKAGIQLRPMPLDLANPLFIAQEPGETVTIPFRAGEPGILRAKAENGDRLEISLDGVNWQTEIPVDSSLHSVTVRHSAETTAHYSLLVAPNALETETPLPPLSQEALEMVPDFPTIDDQSAQYGDLQREQSATFLVKADKPALYEIQSTGLLATSGNLRSRTNPSFLRESQNGIGRNFSLQQYLREGDYQVSVRAEGKSQGHFGLELVRTPIQNGGFLTSRVPARATLEPGRAIAFHFIITEPGEYRLRAIGEGHTFRCRLEDEEGWPLLPPGVEADISRYYPEGRYRMVVLPGVTTRRVVAKIEPTPRPRSYEGHGPHTLPLAEEIDHVWREPAGEDPRTPDSWEFTAPAPMEVFIQLTGEMQGNLFKLDREGNDDPIAIVPPGRGWKGNLAMGRYRIEATSTRRNNLAPYQISVQPTELVPGLSRAIRAPASVPISIGETGLLEFSSFGSDDVQAHLYSDSGTLIASNDDRPDDWNFQIALTLSPGFYRLEVDPAGKNSASTTIQMATPPEDRKPALTLPAQLETVLGNAVHLYPLPSFPSPILFSAAVTSNENIGLALEVLQDNSWKILASQSDKSPGIQIPLGDSDSEIPSSYRLRIWSLDRRPTRVNLQVQSSRPQNAGESRLQSGLSISPSGPESFPQAYRVKLDRPGIFRTKNVSDNICWSAGIQQPCRTATNGTVIAWSEYLWVAVSGPVDSITGSPVRADRLISTGQVEFSMRARGRIRYDLPENQGRPILLTASSQEGQPAVQLMERDREEDGELQNSTVAPRAAASVLLSAKSPSAWVWPATARSGGLNVRVQSYTFPAAETVPGKGTWDGTIQGIRASGFTLGRGAKRFRFTMGHAMVAVLSRGDRVESVLWRNGTPFNASIESEADRLTILHTRREEDYYAVEILPLQREEMSPPIAPGIPYEKTFIHSGIERLPVRDTSKPPGAPSTTLHIRGAAVAATLMGNDGTVSRGMDIVLPPGGGTLEVTHNPGMVLCWLDRTGDETDGLWPGNELSDARAADLPSIHSLDGAVETFKIKTEKPILLHIRTASPSISLLKRGSEKPEIEVHPDGTLIEAYVPRGEAQLSLRAVGERSLFGTVEFTATPVTEIGEGLGPEVLLAPGGSRLFSFEVKTEGPVGVGIQASSDLVESILLSSRGEVLSGGTSQFPNLKPGTYLLALRAPARGEPIHARPAVVGIVPPGDGPPEEVIRNYVQPAEASGEFTE
jgi:hypothetical protein